MMTFKNKVLENTNSSMVQRADCVVAWKEGKKRRVGIIKRDGGSKLAGVHHTDNGWSHQLCLYSQPYSVLQLKVHIVDCILIMIS